MTHAKLTKEQRLRREKARAAELVLISHHKSCPYDLEKRILHRVKEFEDGNIKTLGAEAIFYLRQYDRNLRFSEIDESLSDKPVARAFMELMKSFAPADRYHFKYNLAEEEQYSNAPAAFRFLTITEIANYMNLKNYPEVKRFGSINVFSAVGNISNPNNLLNELATKHNHTAIFLNPITDPDTHDIKYFKLSSKSNVLLEEVHSELKAVYSTQEVTEYFACLNRYKLFLRQIVDELRDQGIITNKLQDAKTRAGNPFTNSFYHVPAKKLELANEYHKNQINLLVSKLNL